MSKREVTPEPVVSEFDSRIQIRRIGGDAHPLRDFYHRMMTTSWPFTIAFVFVMYLLGNVVFACVYLALGDAIDHARPHSFEDAFFFSVQTMATIGYGGMTPKGTVANLVVTAEAISGIIAASLTTGLVFAKFSRPTSRVIFSRRALVGVVDGKRVLVFRVANERSNRIMEASMQVVYTRDETTKEGGSLRRMYELQLQRSTSAVFALSWAVFHTIDDSSPLANATPESLEKEQGAIIVSMTGIDETLAQTVHARKAYDWTTIVFGATFVDIFRNEAGERVMDLSKLHTYVVDEPD